MSRVNQVPGGRIRVALLTTCALVIVLLTGCAEGTLDDPSGQTWQLVELDGATLVEGTVIDMTINDGEVSGSTGCNSYNGPATFTDSGEMTLGPQFAMTFMACEEDIMGQEQRYVDALSQVTGYEMAAEQLMLLDANGVTILTFGS